MGVDALLRVEETASGSAGLRFVASLLVLAGAPGLILGFIFNPGAPPGDPLAQMTAFGAVHAQRALVGAWLQVTGTVTVGIYAMCVMSAAGAARAHQAC